MEQSPTASPTIFAPLQSNLVRTLLTISGICNGCVDDLFLSNQIVGRKLKNERRYDDTYNLDYLWERKLQGQRATSSKCFCPLTAIINIEPPAPEEIEGELSRRLEEEIRKMEDKFYAKSFAFWSKWKK